jgi:hypothetical protein
MKKLVLVLIFICGAVSSYFAFLYFPKLSETITKKVDRDKYDSVRVFRPIAQNQEKKYVFPARFNTPEIAVFIPRSFIEEIAIGNGDFVKKGETILSILVPSDSSQSDFTKRRVIKAPADGYVKIGDLRVGAMVGNTKISVKSIHKLSVSTQIPFAVFFTIKDGISEVKFECPLLPDLNLQGKMESSRTVKQNGLPFMEVTYGVNSPSEMPYDEISLFFSKTLITSTKYTLEHSAVIKDGNRTYIKKLVNGTVMMVDVRLLKDNQTNYLVEGDLSGTDMILKYPNADANTGKFKIPRF